MSEDSERVEELESKVAELEATVRGLTEELVDATERIRQLEAATDVDPAGDHGRAETEETETTDPMHAGPEPSADPEDATEEADTPKAPESKDSADTEDGDVVEDDDIIVA
ncbi:MAG: chromosome segregation protein SMC [Halobacteriaceae archaeon]